MAKKTKPEASSQEENTGLSQPQGFTHGMISDLDPHFQLKGSYVDAQNIRLTNSEGDTFTVENIEGNSLFVDLSTFFISTVPDQGTLVGESGSSTSYPTFFDRGPGISNLTQNLELSNRCSIVGSYSYANQMLLMIVGRFEYERNWTANNPIAHVANRTIFLLVDFSKDFLVTKVTDLRVCYEGPTLDKKEYPDLGMELDGGVRIEAIIENSCISRIYWTDNLNPLRTLNIKQPRLDLITKESLDLTPLMNPSQPSLNQTIHGSLPVGVYQYTYKYISESGGESTFSPLSNLFHVSDQAFGSSITYGGGPKGNLGTQGFTIKVADIDDDFSYIELYALLYEDLNESPRVSMVNRSQISGSEVIFQHTNWNTEISGGLEEILIESNTWDVCKDIAIKDNILFAANLKQKKNWISEKEWNVKVLRYRIQPGSSGTYLDAMLTTDDTSVKHYQGTAANPTIITNGLQDQGNFFCGHGKLLGVAAYPLSSYPQIAHVGDLNNPMWTTCQNQRWKDGADLSARVKTEFEYRYLSDKMTLGGESFNYRDNGLGGARVTFGVKAREADQTKNTSTSPYISATSSNEEFSSEIIDMHSDGIYPISTPGNSNTKFKASMSLGGTKDPHTAGNKRGYQRGEVYRFGVQVYDLTGAPGNVLWIGDMETPQQYDVLRMVETWNDTYTPFRPTKSSMTVTTNVGLVEKNQMVSSIYAQDHRLSYVYGHVVPLIDVEWFTNRQANNVTNLTAYVKPSHPTQATSGEQQGSLPGAITDFTPLGIRKGLTNAPLRQATGTAFVAPQSYPTRMKVDHNYDHTHYLLDLYVNFEFMMPHAVAAKISGFRIVRAVREEEDRRIVQQGLLNQTVQYGDARLELKDGYDGTNFSQKDNSAFDDDPVFTNLYFDQAPTAPAVATPASIPEQPEYNNYLNGYLGLAENCFSGWYDSALTTGKLALGGNFNGHMFYWPESEDRPLYDTDRQSYPIPNHTAPASYKGPGYSATHHRMSAYFGGFDKLTKKNTNGDDKDYTSRTEVSGSIFTLDSPDSAFGVRPYVFRDGDILRIDSVLKLTDNYRYSNGGTLPQGYHSHGFSFDSSVSTAFSNTLLWTPTAKDRTANEATRFASRRNIDENYGILIAKYYCFDPYYGIGMEITGGAYAGSNHVGNWGGSKPSSQGMYLPISAAKELSDGEIVPTGFFKKSRRIQKGKVHGFSNNTLGFIKHSSRNDNEDNFYTFGSVHKPVCAVDGDIDAAWTEALQKKDFTYDTVSTMQMGLRSILIELNTNSSEVRRCGGAATDTWFSHNSSNTPVTDDKLQHSAWFAPNNMSAIYDQGNWLGQDDNGLINWDRPQWMIILSKYLASSLNQPHTSTWTTTGVTTTDYHKGYHPEQFLCSIVRKVTPYGGWTKLAIEKTRYIPCGNFHKVPDVDVNDIQKQGHVSQVFGGDTFVNLYSHQKTSAPYMKKSMVRYKVFPVESYVNTDMRSGLNLNNGDTVIGKEINQAPFSNDWLYNSVYSQENKVKSALMIDEDVSCDALELPYEIAYSNTKILGQKSDAFRVFPINQFHDMEGMYGEINRIINFKNEIYVLQDTAFSKLLVNPLSMLSDESGTSLFTGTGETVENHIYISTKYGTRHRFSVSLSEKSLYFVDSNFARVFKYDTEKLISLGDALGQRNYLKYIMRDWELKALDNCDSTSGDGAPFGTTSTVHPTSSGTQHGVYKGDLNSMAKRERNYIGDNPLKFLGVTSIFDYTNKELMITFHNGRYLGGSYDRNSTSRPKDLHSMANTINGQPMQESQTLVYNEGINAFTSKYSVAPPQWLTGGQGAFIVCPENEIGLKTIINPDYINNPYSTFGSKDDEAYKLYRCNPLKLWLWGIHKRKKKNHFFGKKDDVVKVWNTTSPIDSHVETGLVNYRPGQNDLADESYIVKVINNEAASSKVFDNVQIVMTPSDVPFSSVKYTTDTTHDAVSIYSDTHDGYTIFDEEEELVINRRWDFNDGMDGWSFMSGAGWPTTAGMINTGSSTITLTHAGNGFLRSPSGRDTLNAGAETGLPKQLHGHQGMYNNIIRMRIKRITGSDWDGELRWSGYDPQSQFGGSSSYNPFTISNTRIGIVSEPANIDTDFVIVEWDMSGTPEWDNSRIDQIRFDLASGTSVFEIDWIEMGGLKASKYSEGILKIPLRTEKSVRRSRGTWSKIKYSAQTTDKFNIFAILAKYRKIY
jgi:hypothetical protein